MKKLTLTVDTEYLKYAKGDKKAVKTLLDMFCGYLLVDKKPDPKNPEKGAETRIIVNVEWTECEDQPSVPPQYALVTDIYPELFPNNPDTLELYFIDDELPKLLRAGIRLKLKDLKDSVVAAV